MYLGSDHLIFFLGGGGGGGEGGGHDQDRVNSIVRIVLYTNKKTGSRREYTPAYPSIPLHSFAI